MNKNEIERLANRYSLERYLFDEVTAHFQSEQTLTAYDFFAIIIWKSNRTKTKIASGLERIGATASDLMRTVARAETDVEKVETLLKVWGIGVPIASAILTVCYPDRFTVLDYRAWDAVAGMDVDGLPTRYPHTAKTYVQYCRACRRSADETGVRLRDFDRALWAKSWEDDLLELIGERGERTS